MEVRTLLICCIGPFFSQKTQRAEKPNKKRKDHVRRRRISAAESLLFSLIIYYDLISSVYESDVQRRHRQQHRLRP